MLMIGTNLLCAGLNAGLAVVQFMSGEVCNAGISAAAATFNAAVSLYLIGVRRSRA